ncbi:MAG: lysophospholipid acyltransferase family protein [Desulfobacterales bacterium]|nr:lysophospholipid acyltransferase family protein [Desulfobacterales bacterium]
MAFYAGLDRLIQEIDFRLLLPMMARAPLPLGETLSRLRGAAQAALDYDWRSMALRHRYVRARTREAMAIISPGWSGPRLAAATLRRFMHNSREEWQACLFEREVMEEINRRSTVEGVDELLKIQESGRGLVMVSCHFDSFCMGMVLMGMKGLRVNVINTSIVEDPRIHPAVRTFFKRKYGAMEARMNGKMVYYQEDMPFFYKALERGRTVALMGDIPGSKTTFHIPFLGRVFKMPLGAWLMAKKTGSALGAFMCLHESPGRYRVFCLPPRDIDPEDPVRTMTPVYAFLEKWIRRSPERWVSSDLLPHFAPWA